MVPFQGSFLAEVRRRHARFFALFKGKPIADWGYPYSITSEGFPWSAEFDQARETLCASGLIEVDDRGLMAPRRAELAAELETVLSLGPWTERRPWLRAAVDCALALDFEPPVRFFMNPRKSNFKAA